LRLTHAGEMSSATSRQFRPRGTRVCCADVAELYAFRRVIIITMKKFLAFALVLAVLTPALAAQTAATTFTGKWEGTLIQQPPTGDGKTSQPAVLNLTQKGSVLTGTAGPPDQQWPITKGMVKGGVATFEVQEAPGAPVFKVSVSIVKGRLQGDVTAEGPEGQKMAAKIDAARAK
jgi:hypothetical protein